MNQVNAKFLDMLATLDDRAKNASFVGGSGGGWPAVLAYQPCGKLSLKGSEATADKLINFTKAHHGKLITGFISYDFGHRLQGITAEAKDDLGLPDIYFLAYDNYQQEDSGRIIAHGADPAAVKKSASKAKSATNFQTTLPRKKYDQLFDKTMEYIKAGQIYQLNLAHRLRAKSNQNPRQLFGQIAGSTLAPMMGYIEGDGFELLSFSPERFVRIAGRSIVTTPIKGTLVRSTNAQKKLLDDPKEQSELAMITDLLRNDLAKICQTGSVKLLNRRSTQTLSNLIHTYSEISGQLRRDISPIEALLAMFPGGSITGCPKRRAMQIIGELEPNSRGPYCGSLVRIKPDGSLDSSILIRTIIKKQQNLILPVGGGLVFDSDKHKEYQETLDKAQSIINSLK